MVSSTKSGSKLGVIVGVAVGGGAVVLIAIAGIYHFYFRRRVRNAVINYMYHPADGSRTCIDITQALTRYVLSLGIFLLSISSLSCFPHAHF